MTRVTSPIRPIAAGLTWCFSATMAWAQTPAAPSSPAPAPSHAAAAASPVPAPTPVGRFVPVGSGQGRAAPPTPPLQTPNAPRASAAQPTPAPASTAAPAAAPAVGGPPAAGAGASEPSPTAAPAPESVAAPQSFRLHHAPPATATVHAPLVLVADLDHPEQARRVLLVYRAPGTEEAKEVEFERAPGGYAAVIPEAEMSAGTLVYRLDVESLDGTRHALFPAIGGVHAVQIAEAPMDSTERALLERQGGRRSVMSLGGDYVDFGTSTAYLRSGAPEGVPVHDRYYRLEGSYSYRPLRQVSEIGIRLGMVRGTSAVANADTKDDLKVGLNYGAPFARFWLSDLVTLEGSFLTSVTQIGFSVGAGSALVLGDALGSNLTLGFETIQVFGTRMYSRVDVLAAPGLRISPMVEVTDMPNASHYGIRLTTEIGADLGRGFFGAVRGGYQARRATSGGASGGLTLGYAF